MKTMTRRRFLTSYAGRAAGLASAVALSAHPRAVAAAAETRRAESPTIVGSEKHLFIDERFIQFSEGIRLAIGHPVKTGQRLIACDRPWEDCSVGGVSIVQDADGSLKMWYVATHRPGKGEDSLKLDKLCFASSSDGIRWEKPNLGLVQFGGSTHNNIVFQAESMGWGPGVFRDPAVGGDDQYKLIYGDRHFPFKAPEPYGTYGSICGATSPDGVHWHPLRENPIMPWYKDTQTAAFWDEHIHKYVAYVRDNDWKNPARFRRIGRSETTDFSRWPAPTLVLAPDDDDPPDCDLYTSAAIKYPYAADVYLMFPSVFHHKSDRLDIELAVSRDGIKWQRAGRREPFMRVGRKGEFDSMGLYAAVGIARTGDELFLYYCGFGVGHDAFTYQMRNVGVISRAALRLDGFVSADADRSGGEFTTPSIVFRGTRLEFNIDTSAGGDARVAMLRPDGADILDHAFERCDPINGNDPARTVTWKGKSDVSSLAGQPVKVRVRLRSAKLYAFQFRGV